MYYVGIDIAKSFHVVTILDGQEKKVTSKPLRVVNDSEGFDGFIQTLKSICDKDNFLIGLEATGIYGENLLEFLKFNGYNVKLLNPFQTTRYREQYTMKKVKNDNIDSWMIALLLKDGKFSSGYVTDDEYQSLRTLYRNRDSILTNIKESKKRILTQVVVTFPEFENFTKDMFSKSSLALLDKYPTAHHYENSSVDRILKVFRHIKGNNFNSEKALKVLTLAKTSIYSGKAKNARAIAIRSSIRLLRVYQEELAFIESEISTLLKNDGVDINEVAPTNSLIENLKTIPGISTKSIAAIISECGDLSRFKEVSRFIGYLGLFPTENSSGNHKGKGKLSKRGSSLAKKALYLASVSCVKHNKELKLYYDNKRSSGKSSKEGFVAVSLQR